MTKLYVNDEITLFDGIRAMHNATEFQRSTICHHGFHYLFLHLFCQMVEPQISDLTGFWRADPE